MTTTAARAQYRYYSALLVGAFGALSASCFGNPIDAPAVAVAALDPAPESDELWESAPVGSTQGGAGLTSDGASTYTIPIAVPDGPAGFSPNLALAYHSRGGASSVGVGWSIQGTSAITRCSTNLARDGDRAPVRFDSSDVLCLDGQRLFNTSGDLIPESGLEHIRPVGSLDDPATYFIARLPDGGRRFYGGPGASFHPPGLTEDSDGNPVSLESRRTYQWLLAEERDSSGNVIEYEWTIHGDHGEPLLQRVSWGALTTDQDAAPHTASPSGRIASVEFDWEERPDHQETVWRDGIEIHRSHRLVGIESGTNAASEGTLRRYEITYVASTATDRWLLASVAECDLRGICLAPITFQYSGEGQQDEFDSSVIMDRSPGWWDDLGQEPWGPGSNTVRHVTPAPGALIPGDFNGDGRDDLLYWDIVDSVYIRWYVRLAAGGSAGSYGPPLLAHIEDSVTGAGLPPIRVVDFDRDGDDDILTREWGEDVDHLWKSYAYTWTGSNFAVADENWGCEQSNYWDPVPPMLVGDFDGNGASDVIISCPNYQSTTLPGGVTRWTLASVEQDLRWHTNGNWWSYTEPAILETFPVTTAAEYDPLASRSHVLDTDGDGVAEVLLVRPDDPTRLTRTQLHPSRETIRRRTNLEVVEGVRELFLDVNGDGLVDVLEIHEDGNALALRMNTARGFLPATEIAPPAAFPWLYERRQVVDFRVLDFNSDGRQDFLLFHEEVFGESPPITVLHLASSDAAGNAFFRTRELPIGPGFKGIPRSWGTTQVLDVDGDEVPDLITVEGDDVIVHINKAVVPDLLTRASGNHRLAASLSYVAGRRWADRDQDCAYPQACAPIAGLMVVNEHWTAAAGAVPQAFRRFYGAPRTDVRGRGWLGYDYVRTNELTGGQTATEVEYDLRTRFSTEAGGVFTATYSYVARTIPTAVRTVSLLPDKRAHVIAQTNEPEVVFLNGAHSRYVVRTRHLERREYELPAWPAFPVELAGFTPFTERIESSEWDQNGYPERVETSVTGATRTVVETPRYDREWSSGIQSLVDVVRVISWPDYVNRPEHKEVRELDLSHDERGRVQSVTRVGEGSGYRRTSYGRDSHGNISYVALTGYEPNDAEETDFVTVHRQHWIQYDTAGVYPIETEDGLNHITMLQYHPTLGVLQRVTDPNGVVDRSFYDGFGRIVREQPADGSAVVMRYETPPSSSQFAWVRVAVDGADSSQATIDLDSFGRPLSVRRLVAAGSTQRWSVQSTEYDIRGRVKSASLPTFEGVTPPLVLYEYDDLNRLTQENSAGRVTRHNYAALVHTATNPRGYSREYTSDTARRLVTADEGADGTKTTYTYGAFGSLTEIDADDGVVWAATYDTWGRLRELDDPDSGVERSTYNSFGELVFTENAAGEHLEVRRDGLGRQVWRKSSVDGTTRFVWDDPTDGAGRLSLACAEDERVCTEYDYDHSTGGRSREILTIAGVDAFQSDYHYDEVGRLSVLEYPEVAGRASRFAVEFEYELGSLDAVRENGGTSATFYAVGTRDARGNATSDYLGTLMRSRSFSAQTGAVETIRTRRFDVGGLVTLQDLAFTHDQQGNIQSRRNDETGRKETFTYDSLDRLDTWQVAGHDLVDYDYDRHGNLTLNADEVQEFGPDSSGDFYGPHALRERGGDRYTYDDAGRQSSGGSRDNVEYTAAGLPRTITTSSGNQTHFLYSASGRRVHSESGSASSTSYAGDLFERRTTGKHTSYVFHVFANGEEVAQVTRTAGTEETTFLLADGLGTLDATTNAAGTVTERFEFDPFGRRVNTPGASSVTHRHRWVGHESDDDSGLINMRGRMYDPETGRFLTTDPVSLAPWSPQAMNSYSYVLNNPTTLRDSTGLHCDGLSRGCSLGGPGGGGTASAGIGPGDQWGGHDPGIASDAPRADSTGSVGSTAVAQGTVGSQIWDGVVSVAEWLERSGTADVLAGAGDMMTLGATRVFREATDLDGGVIDTSSDEYYGGVAVGAVVLTGGTLGATTGGGMLVGDALAARVLASNGARTLITAVADGAYAEVTGGATIGGGVGIAASTGGGGGGGGRVVGTALSWGANATAKLRSHWGDIRRLAAQQGVQMPRRFRDASAQIDEFISHIVHNGETVIAPYKPTSGGSWEAQWTRLGDAIVIRMPDGRFLSILDARDGGQALNFPGGR